MKFLKNYTSEVPVNQTIFNIEKVLLKCGVTGITKDYDASARVSAVSFKVASASGDIVIRIPVNEKSAIDALWHDYADGDKLSQDGSSIAAWSTRKKKKRSDFIDQGSRTAWKIMQDWIEVQMSMIQMKQAEPLEVFLPYIWDGKQTVYNRVSEGGMRMLIPEKTP